MLTGVLNQGVETARNLAPDPRATNPALYRSTGTVATGTIGGVSCLKATRATSGSMQIVVDKKYFADVEGFKVGDKIYWSADVYVTTPADVQMIVLFGGGGNEDTVSSITPQTPANGWVRHYGESTITATPAGSYFEYRIHTVNASVPAGEGFYFRNLSIQKNLDAGYFDGSTNATPAFTYEWAGAANNSVSIRRMAVSEDVLQLQTLVYVNGTQREIMSFSQGRDLVGDLPEQVAAAGGVSQATGSVVWASKDVDTGSLNPWNPSTGWIPMKGDRVEIYVSNGVTTWPRFKGIVDKTTGSVFGGIESTLIDGIDRFSKQINIPALITQMPPLNDGEAVRRVGLSTQFHINTALRQAGYYTTPKREFGAVLDAPLIGSCWPLTGDVRVCYRQSDPLQGPGVAGAPWGASRTDMTAEYLPSTSRAGDVPVQLTMVRTSEHTGTAFVKAVYGTSNAVELRLTPTRAVARVNEVEVAAIDISGDTVAQVLFKNGAVTVATATSQATATVAWGVTASLGYIRVEADANSRIAGIQVSHPTAAGYELASVNHVMSAEIRMGQFLNAGHQALPAVTNTPARDLMDEITKSTLRPFWIDETGMARVIASDVIYDQSPAQKLTTLDDIRELAWESSYLGVRSEVVAKYLKPIITARSVESVTVWEASDAVVLKTDETYETVIEPGSDEDWVMVDGSPTHIGGPSLTAINRGETSFYGGIVTDGVNELYASPYWPSQDWADLSLNKLGATSYQFKAKAKTIPSGNQLELRTFSSTFSGNTALWPMWWGKNLPIIRAKARVQWTQMQRDPTIAGTTGGTLELDMGPWATGGETTETTAIDAIASFVAEQITQPQPTITSLRVGYDPRRQLGDVITVSSPNLLGVSLTCLVTGYQESADSGGYEQSLSVRIIDAQTTFTTYEQFMKAWGNSTSYETFMQAWTAVSTYNDFNLDPLKGAS